MRTTPTLPDDDLLDLYRVLRPRARRTAATAIIHSGSVRTVFGCVCGAAHTTSTEWRGRDALHVSAWEHEHAGCLRAFVEAHRPGDWAARLLAYREARARRTRAERPERYGQDLADGAACRAMAVALAAVGGR